MQGQSIQIHVGMVKLMPFPNVIKHMDIDHVNLKVCGDYLWNLSDSYLIQNENLTDIAFSVHTSQIRLSEWEHATNINDSVIDAAKANEKG